MHGDCKHDAMLRKAWVDFCEELKEAGEVVFRDGAPAGSVDRAVGLRYIARNIPLALAFHLENRNPLHPEMMRYFDPTRKQGGDNGDAVYLGAPIDGTLRYRISGRRGGARFLAITVLEDGETPWGGAVVGNLFGNDLECDEVGNFELHLGLEPVPGNFIRTTPKSFRVTIRQFFADWEHEEPMTARIDCLDTKEPPTPLAPQELCEGLAASAEWLRWSTTYWAEKLDLWRAMPNHFIGWRDMVEQKIDATPGGTPLICYWELPEDEALVIRVTPPTCAYWNCEFGSYWFETMDYRYRLAGLNSHYAHLEEDSSLAVVVSHDDPGAANWLDTSGHQAGYITFRWMGARENPVPVCQQVKRAELAKALPRNYRRLSPSERREQIAAHRRGVCRRFRT